MVQLPADVQADILGAVNNPHQVTIIAEDAPTVNQPIPAVSAVTQNPVQAQAEPVQDK